MNKQKVVYPQKGEHYNNEIIIQENQGIKTTFGTVFLEKGSRLPAEGFNRHEFNEVSIITKGCLEMLNEDESILGYFKAGEAMYLDAREAHAANVVEDTELVYVLNQKV